MEQKQFRVVVFQESPGAWVSQCVDVDINGQGSSVREALNSVVRVICMQATLDARDQKELFSRTPAAPSRFKAMFEDSFAIREDFPVNAGPVNGHAEFRIHA